MKCKSNISSSVPLQLAERGLKRREKEFNEALGEISHWATDWTHCRSDLANKWLQTRRLKTRVYSYAAFFSSLFRALSFKGGTWQHLQSSCRMQTPARASVAAGDRPIGFWGGFMSRWKTWEVCFCRAADVRDVTRYQLSRDPDVKRLCYISDNVAVCCSSGSNTSAERETIRTSYQWSHWEEKTGSLT